MKIINENVIRKVLKEQLESISVERVISDLESIGCPGGDLKKLVIDVLLSHGYEDVKLSYLGKDENNELIYLVYTEGPIYLYKGRSSSEGKPCLEIFDVSLYEKSI